MHPNAREFFERDIQNLSKYFAKQGVNTDYDKMYADIKLIADEMKKGKDEEVKQNKENRTNKRIARKNADRKVKKNKRKR
jgi:RIO-like serine/threonine protein kinase